MWVARIYLKKQKKILFPVFSFSFAKILFKKLFVNRTAAKDSH